MVSALSNQEGFILNRINQPMFLIYATRPKTCKVVLQRFWLPDSFKRRSLYVFQQGINPFERSAIFRLPEQVIIPSLV